MELLAFLVLSLLSALAAASSPLSTDIFYWSLSAIQPSRLAQVTYDPSTLQSTITAYTPPSDVDANNDLLRIGLYTSDKQWVGSLSSLVQLSPTHSTPTMTLHLGPDNQPYHVSLSPSTSSKQQGQPNVVVVRSDRAAAPSPHLNKPVVVTPGSRGPEEVQEKTLFQR